MFPNLEIELARCKYSEEYVAEYLGITPQQYLLRKKTGLFLESEVLALIALCNRSSEYLFESDVK